MLLSLIKWQGFKTRQYTTKQKTIIIFLETTKFAHYKNCDKQHKFIMTSIHIYGIKKGRVWVLANFKSMFYKIINICKY